MLGIVWGIATVTLLIAYGGSFREILVSGFNAFGKGAVICWPQQTSEQPGGQRAGKKVVFEQADLEMVRETANFVKHACLETVRRPGIAYGDRMVGTAAVRGVCPEYGEMRNEEPSEGRWINSLDELERRRVAFLGARVRDNSSADAPPSAKPCSSAAFASRSSAPWNARFSSAIIFPATTNPPGSLTRPPATCGTQNKPPC